jgi:hypothetical protein
MTLSASKGYHPAFPPVFLGRPLETLGGPHTDDLPQRVADADEAEMTMKTTISFLFGCALTIACAVGNMGCSVTILEPGSVSTTPCAQRSESTLASGHGLASLSPREITYELSSRPRAAVDQAPEMKPLQLAPQCASCSK